MAKLFRMTAVAAAALIAGAFPFTMAGCDADREVMEVETPDGEVEVEEDADTGALETETN